MKVWDVPTRLFHWVLVALILICWASAEFDRFDIHYYAGYGVFTLILFRLIWGVIGSDTALLASCLYGPSAILRYVHALPSKKAEQHLGHNPIGGLSVLAMIVLLGVQVGLGLFSQDIDFINAGPLSALISFDAGTEAAELHELLFDGILVLVALHLAAIFYYLFWKRENLIKPMLTGWRVFGDDGPMTPPTIVPTRRALIVAVACAAFVFFTVEIVPGLAAPY